MGRGPRDPPVLVAVGAVESTDPAEVVPVAVMVPLEGTGVAVPTRERESETVGSVEEMESVEIVVPL